MIKIIAIEGILFCIWISLDMNSVFYYQDNVAIGLSKQFLSYSSIFLLFPFCLIFY